MPESLLDTWATIPASALNGFRGSILVSAPSTAICIGLDHDGRSRRRESRFQTGGGSLSARARFRSRPDPSGQAKRRALDSVWRFMQARGEQRQQVAIGIPAVRSTHIMPPRACASTSPPWPGSDFIITDERTRPRIPQIRHVRDVVPVAHVAVAIDQPGDVAAADVFAIVVSDTSFDPGRDLVAAHRQTHARRMERPRRVSPCPRKRLPRGNWSTACLRRCALRSRCG